jgi:hypothetical protein
MLKKISLIAILFSIFNISFAQKDSTGSKYSITTSGSIDAYFRNSFLAPSGVTNNLTSFTNSNKKLALGMASLKIDQSLVESSNNQNTLTITPDQIDSGATYCFRVALFSEPSKKMNSFKTWAYTTYQAPFTPEGGRCWLSSSNPNSSFSTQNLPLLSVHCHGWGGVLERQSIIDYSFELKRKSNGSMIKLLPSAITSSSILNLNLPLNRKNL